MVYAVGDVKPLIEKLSHSLEDVRVPALRSLLSKLELSLITVEDLCQEKLLFVKLLEWFNYENVTNEDLVFNLLNKLVSNRASADILLRIGAVDFFSQLRPNVQEKFLPEVDSLIHKLLTVPDVIEIDPEINFSRNQVNVNNNTTLVNLVSNERQRFEEATEAINERHNFTNRSNIATVQFEQLNQSSEYIGDVGFIDFLYFPWRPLTHSDKTVLESAKSSLIGGNSSIVILSCKFINDVLFSDFPAEVFLQHPSIVEELFELIKVRQRKNWDLHLEPLNALITLTENLLKRFSVMNDPHYHTPSLLNHGHALGTSYANKASSSVVEDLSRSMSQAKCLASKPTDTSFCSESTIEGPFRGQNQLPEIDEEEELIAEDIKTCQYSVPQYCAVVLSSLQHLFKSSNLELILKTTELSLLVTELITKSINIEVLWKTESALASIFRKDIEVFAHALTVAIKSHSGQIQVLPAEFDYNLKDRENEVSILNLIVMIFGKFSTSVLTSVKVIKSSAHALEVKTVASEVIYNYEFSKFYPSIRQQIIDTCITNSSRLAERLAFDEKVLTSIENLSEVMKPEQKLEAGRFVESIKDSHLALSFSQSNFELIDRLIEMTSDYCDYSDHFYSTLLSVLTEYLKSPNDAVRSYTYKGCQKFVEKCLEIDANANKMTNQPSQMLKFLLTEEILTVFIQNGLLDQNENIKETACWMLYEFLNSQLLFESETWNFFINNVMHYFVFLQSLTSKDSKFGATLLNMVAESQAVQNASVLNIPPVDKLRGCLRLMFNTDLKVRIEAVGMLVWHLAREAQGHLKLPSFSNSTMPRLHNLMFPENQITVEKYACERMKTKTQTLDSVLDIAQSSKLDEGVKKSAFDQVAILLQDPNIHQHFIDRNGIGYIESTLSAALEKANEDKIEHQYLPSVVSIFRNLFFWQSKIRHRFSHDSRMLYSLVRSAFVLTENVGALADVHFAIALLLFDEVLQPGNEEIFSIPRIIRLHFKLPFTAEAQDFDSNRESHPVLPSKTENPLSVAYLEACLKDLVINQNWGDGERTESTSFHDGQLNIAKSLSSIINAQNHLTVSENLQLLKSYLLLSQNEPDLYAKYLSQLDFSVALERFLSASPSSNEDRKLLGDITDFINFLLRNGHSFGEIKSWVDNTLASKERLVLTCLNDPSTQSDLSLTDCLLKCLLNFGLQKSAILDAKSAPQIVSSVIERIKVCDNAETYDLASLHKCLTVLAVVTETKNWSELMKELIISQIFPTLVSIINSFSTGRISNLSFMGCAVIEMILRVLGNLAREMTKMFRANCVWIEQWKRPSLENQQPFNWLTSLLAHRNPQIRLLSYNLVAQFSVHKRGQIIMDEAFKRFAGGLWTILFEVALDKSECCAVKTQCIATLVQLTKDQNFPSLDESDENCYVGPLVVDNLENFPVSGLRALEKLIVSFELFPIFAQALMQYFPFSAVKLAQKVSGSNSLEKFNLEFCRMNLELSQFSIEASEAVATPAYIAALCNFMSNCVLLLPEVSLKAFKSFNLYQSLLRTLDDSVLSRIVQKYDNVTNLSDKFRLRILFQDLVVMYKSIVQLLTFLHVNFSKVVPNASLLVSTLTRFLCLKIPSSATLLEEKSDSNRTKEAINLDLRHETLTLIAQISRSLKTLLQKYEAKCLSEESLAVLRSQNNDFCCVALTVIRSFSDSQSNVGEFLNLMTFLLARLPEKFLEVKSVNDSDDCFMSKVTGALIILLDLKSSQSPNKTVENCLRTILATSEYAKQTALREKFPQFLVDQLQSSHCKLTTMCITSLHSSTARDENIGSTIYACFNMIRNIMFNSEECKNVFHNLGFTPLVSKLWHWCITDAPLMHAMFECLQVYAARCHNAALSMSLHSIPQNSVSVNRHASSNTIVNLLIKAALKESNQATATRTNLPLLNAIFALLQTLSLTTECRGIMWKANFLQKFSELNVPKKILSHPSNGQVAQNCDESFLLWLNLFVNVSFSSDGQQMIAKMNTSIDKIIETLRMSITQVVNNIVETTADVAIKCLTILHNLCFNLSNKSKLLANAAFVPTLMRVLSESQNEKIILAVSATFWAILFSNQKAKVAFKSALLLPVVQKTLLWVETKIANDSRNANLFKASCYLKSINSCLLEK
ncbi:rotatin-like [Convolutriloba macropyga]|uniref:rotatin-like n=1 Tax=Convolutriloba macropyga TaxID=536237 RepID=UPI003F51F01A